MLLLGLIIHINNKYIFVIIKMVKVLVLYVFHKFNDSVDHFLKHCIFRDENIDFLIIANDINFKFNLVNLPEYVMTMVRKNVGRDFGGWSEGLLKDQFYKI